MTYFQAYLLTRLDSFSSLLNSLIAFGLVAIVILCVILFAETVEPEFCNGSNIKKYFFIILPITLLFSILNAMIPTTKEAAFIYIAPALVNNKDVQKTLKKLPELSGLGLEYLGDILKQEIKKNINNKIK
jgi:hypothetical protein